MMADKNTINEFEQWCDSMNEDCPVVCLDALALLKEQERKLNSIVCFESGDKVRLWHCPLCRSEVMFVLKGGAKTSTSNTNPTQIQHKDALE